MKNLKIYSKLFDKKQYIAVEDFTKTIREVEDSLNNQMQEKISELKKKYASMEKEYRKLQVEHSRLLFDMDAVIEHEVDVKCKKLKEELRMLKEGATLYREDNKKLREKISEITMVADDEKQSIEHILELEKENEELKKQNDRLTTQIAKQLLKNV